MSPMKWETWDEDVKELLDVDGGCESGTNFVFHMKDGGMEAPVTLRDVVENESVTFEGNMLGGAMGFVGTILLTPQGDDEATTKVDYSFEVKGCIGGIVSLLNSKAIVGGTEKGLENIVRLSEEEAQHMASEKFTGHLVRPGSRTLIPYKVHIIDASSRRARAPTKS